MKNVKKYICFAIFLSFAFLGNVFGTENVTAYLPDNATSSKIDFSNFVGVSCPLSSNSTVKLIQNADSEYEVSWVDGASKTKGAVDFNCTFDSIPSLPYHLQPEDKTLVVNVKYGLSKSVVSFDLVKDRQESVDVLPLYMSDVKKIIEVSREDGSNDPKYEAGNSYTEVDCPLNENTKCVIKLNNSLPRDNLERYAFVEVKYEKNDGSLSIVHFYIDIYSISFAFAYPGSYGTCNFDATWTEGDDHYRKQVEGATIDMPSCEPSTTSNPLLKFEGWINFDNREDSFAHDYMAINSCKTYVNAYAGSNSYVAGKDMFVSCYSTMAGIILVPAGGKIPMLSNYTDVEGAIYVKQEGSVTLPEPTSIPSAYNMYGSARFEGWSDSSGVLHAAGTTVPADGSRYMAVYSTGLTPYGDETNQKMIYVGETSNYKLNSTTIQTCVSSDTNKVTANVSGGECMLHGVESTGADYVDVLVTTAGGNTKTVKVRVVNKESDIYEDADSLVVLDDFLPEETQDGYYENVAGADICNTYLVSNHGRIDNNVATHDDFTITITKFNSVSQCDNTEYLTLCMDPGRPGPVVDELYEVDKSFTTENEFGKLVTHIVQKFVNESHDVTNISAANIALRIIEYYAKEELAESYNGTTEWYRKSLAAYKAIGTNLKSVCPDISACTKNQIYNALGNKWTWHNDSVRNQVAAYLADFDNTATGTDKSIKNQTNRKGTYDEANDFLYHIEYSGTLTFPDGMTVSESDIVANCGSVPGVSNCNQTGSFISSSVYEYKFTFDVDLNNAGFYVPKSTNEESPFIEVRASAGVTSANVFVIKSIANNKQRMVIFNTEPVELKVIMPIYLVCDINKKPFTIGDPGFREDLFKVAGCCEYITDETSNEFLTYCTADCIQSNFTSVCDPNFVVGDNDAVDVYTINEAYKANASGSKELNYSCIVDVSDAVSAMDNTNSFVDNAGNNYAVKAYASNQYCAVSCKEDWDLSTSAFENFTGLNAIYAGNGFKLRTEHMFIGGSRTCVTTYIDYDKYKTELRQLSKEITNLWNTQSEYSKVYSVLDDSVEETSQTYTTYKNTGTYDCDCETDPDTGAQINCRTCYTWEVDSTETCRVYSISTAAGGSFDKANWSDAYGYATSGSGNISTSSLGGAAGGGSEIHTDWSAGSVPSVYDSSCPSCQGYCNSAQNKEYLLDVVTYKGANVKDTIDSSKDAIEVKKDSVSVKSLDMAKCQNFELKNTSKAEKNEFNYDSSSTTNMAYTGNALITGFVSKKSNEIIETKFEPIASYTYDEYEFMELVGKDNYIIPNMDENIGVLNKNGYDISSFNNTCVSLALKNSKGENLQLCKNKVETEVYNPSGAWDPGTNEAKIYGGTGDDLTSVAVQTFKITICDTSSGYDYDSRGDCGWDEGDVSYYPIHYIKQTIKNSSFYANKGHWWINNDSDSKVHADDESEAVSKFNSGISKDDVSLFIAKYNVFPVGLTTPRNMYRYKYTYADIGYFSDGTPGRIIGDVKTSLIPINTHACFYEVVENLCICCGDPILVSTYTETSYIENQEYFDEKGYDYSMSGITYDPDIPLHGYLSFINSTVSLYDIDGADDMVPSNWSTEDLFNYNYNKYTTNKGDVLAKELIKKGELVYDTSIAKPEYSYTLNPTTISLIQEYNVSHPYGYSSYDVVNYGISNKETPFDASVSVVDSSNSDEVITFSHFGSKFLEDFLKSYVTDEYKNNILTKRTTQGTGTVCSVNDGADAARQAFEKIQNENCRWVDYIEVTDDGQRVRLAFK